MLRIRRVEERIQALYPEGDIRCPTHLCVGQEAVAAGVCANLQPDDYVISAHRSHAHYLAKGGALRAMFAELYGKEDGCASGKGGSMHLIDLSVNFLGCVPIVGSTIPIGVGAAFGAMLQNRDCVSVVFFGDAAVETGVFHESVNFAAVHRLPVLFVCENNLYSVNTPLAERQPANRTIAQLAAGHGITSAQHDGQEVEAVYGGRGRDDRTYPTGTSAGAARIHDHPLARTLRSARRRASRISHAGGARFLRCPVPDPPASRLAGKRRTARWREPSRNGGGDRRRAR